MTKRTPRPPVVPEKDVAALIVQWFATIGITLHRRNTGVARMHGFHVRFNKNGMSDWWGIEPKTGKHIEVEIKRLGKEPDEKQHEWIAECLRLGAISMWANSLEMAQEKWKLLRVYQAFRHI